MVTWSRCRSGCCQRNLRRHLLFAKAHWSDDVLLVYSDASLVATKKVMIWLRQLQEHLQLAHTQSADAILFSVLGGRILPGPGRIR